MMAGGFERLLSDQGFREKERNYSYRLQRTFHEFISGYYIVDTIQDLLCELGIKPHMHSFRGNYNFLGLAMA